MEPGKGKPFCHSNFFIKKHFGKIFCDLAFLHNDVAEVSLFFNGAGALRGATSAEEVADKQQER